MKRIVLLFIFIIFCLPATAMEIEQPEAVQSIHHVIPIDDEEQTIEETPKQEYDDLYFPNEVELKGTVIYNEGAKHAQEIELDKTVEKPQVNLKTKHMIIPVRDEKIYTTGIDISQRSPLSTATRITGEEYSVKPIWSYINEQTGNFSYGTIYSSAIDTCQLQSTMNLYTRYDFKYFAITGAVGTNESNVEGTRDEKTIQISPEIKLSKSFVIRDTIQAYVNETYKKNKISIIYTPQWKKHPDMLRFELGFSNTYYTGGRIRSAVEFSTRIRL
ncbi:MAG: hypothetical protein K6E29_08400 [Cyanobacteria bacterium RUI128]|nr:hypothetical protein [Cyanobacteria bacterium RUI128]